MTYHVERRATKVTIFHDSGLAMIGPIGVEEASKLIRDLGQAVVAIRRSSSPSLVEDIPWIDFPPMQQVSP